MLQDSRDILNFALTASVIILTFFVSWILYYVVTMIRDVRKMLHDVTRVTEKLNAVLDIAREKITSMAALLPLVVKGVEKVVETVSSYREKKRAKRETEDEEA